MLRAVKSLQVLELRDVRIIRKISTHHMSIKKALGVRKRGETYTAIIPPVATFCTGASLQRNILG